jgi:hypothetical protein
MANEVGAITYADVPGFPAGTVVDHILVTATDAAIPPVNPMLTQSVPEGTATVTFTGIAFGAYTFSVQAETAAGQPLGTAVTGKFTVVAPVVTLSLPATAVFTQA